MLGRPVDAPGANMTDFLSPREGLFNCFITLLSGRDSIYGSASSRTKLHGAVEYKIRKHCLLYADSGSAIHSLITNRGRALQVIFRRLNKALDLKQKGWHEREDLKSVSQMLGRVALGDSPFDPVTDDAPPKHGSGTQGLRLMDPEYLNPSDCGNLVRRISSTIDIK